MTPETTKILQNLKTYASTWETDVRLLGNVQAGEIVKAITEVLDQKENITPPRPKPDPLCPECNQPASQHPALGPTTLNGKKCDMVYGRRGWRQLGAYDG